MFITIPSNQKSANTHISITASATTKKAARRRSSFYCNNFMILASLGIVSFSNNSLLTYSYPSITATSAFISSSSSSSSSSRHSSRFLFKRSKPFYLTTNSITTYNPRNCLNYNNFSNLHKNNNPSFKNLNRRLRSCSTKLSLTNTLDSAGTNITSSPLTQNLFDINKEICPSKRSMVISTNSNMTGTTTAPVGAKLVSSSDESLQLCAKRLNSDDALVSFPTETVYGLGCNALSPTAVQKVFQAKRRPLTDPLIVHVLDTESALKLWNTISDTHGDISNNTKTKEVLIALANHFFPGPLTIVAKCNKDLVPDIITAGTGYVAVRSPSHPIARRLIELSGVPIAAPSANRFGHVSPTKSIHVMEDLELEDVWVVHESHEITNDILKKETTTLPLSSLPCCNVGVESTVAKVDETLQSVSILRQGAISAQDIKECLTKAELADDFSVDVKVKTTSEQVANIAPGQTVRHYSPDVISYMISEKRWQELQQPSDCSMTKDEIQHIQNAVMLDFGGKLRVWKAKALAYRDLSITGNSKEGATRVFDYLRWAEQVDGAERIYFPELAVNENTDALTLAIKDRLTRAASGVVVDELQ